MLEKEFEYYVENQAELVKKFRGKFLVIKDRSVQGVYDTIDEAYEGGKAKFKIGTFLIQEVQPGEENYTQTFHSRVIFDE